MYGLLHTGLMIRERENNPIQVAIAGAGFLGRGAIIQASFMKGIRIAAIICRDLNKAADALAQCKQPLSYALCATGAEINRCMREGKVAILKDYRSILDSSVDIVIDATGNPEYGALLAYDVLMSGKHMSSPPELDIAVGPRLKEIADEKGGVYSGQDGDEPAVIVKLFHHVSIMGFDVTSIGKFKGFNNRYATPDTVKPWAEMYRQSPLKISSFADGTKMSMEMGIVANATGYLPDKRGMHMPNGKLEDVLGFMRPLSEGGLLSGEKTVDAVSGVNPGGGIFVIGKSLNPQTRSDMTYYKMGDGPYFLFYRPYHMPSVELLTGAAESVLFSSPVIVPKHTHALVDVPIFAKKDMAKGECLDGIGGYTYYGLLDTVGNLAGSSHLPVSMAENARLVRNISKDDMICLSDVDLDDTTVLWKLYREQKRG